jgi:hypothetical protein
MSTRRTLVVRAAAAPVAAAAALLALPPLAPAQPLVDGTLDAAIYGAPIAVQTVNTGFGNNQSELDAMYVHIANGKLYVMATGNLESNLNRFMVFFDTRAGGQNVMRADNPDVDFNDLNNRYAGMTFDAGFEPDYAFFFARDVNSAYPNFSELNTNGGGLGGFLGNVDTPGFPQIGAGTVGGQNGLPVVQLGINDSNTAGVSGEAPNAADPVAAAAVTTGIEFAIDLPQIGAIDNFKVMIGINGSFHDFWSNQFFPGLQAPQGNLGSDGLGNFVPHPTLPVGGTVASMNFNNTPGDQFLTLNYSAPRSEWDAAGGGNWSTAANWTNDAVPNAPDAIATLGALAGAGARTVTLDIPVSLQRVVFDSAGGYTIAASGGNALTIAGNPATPSVVVNAGANVIAAPLVLGSTTNFGVATGASLDVTGDLTATGRAVVKSGGGLLQVKNVRGDSLNVVEGTARIAANGTAAGVSRMNALIIAGGPTSPTATLDLTNNGLVLDYTPPPPPPPEGDDNSPFDETRALIISGRAGGAWTGTGITSSLAAANPNTHGIGIAEASDVLGATGGTFMGQEVDGSTVLVRYTRLGDANLDGTTGIGDFSLLGANFNTAGNWAQGDFNYDGNVDIGDFSLLASNFNQSAADGVSARGGAVPEPAAMGLIALAATGLVRRRRG